MIHIHPMTMVRYGLAFVAFYFGISEIMSPADWVSFVPKFLGSANAETLVMIHGVVLCAIGLSLVTKIYHRVAATIFSIMLVQIIAGIIFRRGLNPTAARDIAILGSALGVALSKNE